MAIKKIKVNGTDHEIHLPNTLSFKKNGSSAGAFDGSSNVEVDLTPTIDSSLSSTSTNPVQNKVVKAALDAKAPIDHSSASSQYGQGTRQKFGHVLLCDDIEATWDEDSGLAATPYAVKRVYDYAKGFKAYSIMRFQNATSTYADAPTDGDGFFEAIAHRHGDTIGFIAGNNLINFEVTDHGSEAYGTDSVVVTVNADYNGAADEALAESKNYTDTKILGLINGAPAALDTLNELATALGKDANFSTTITNLIGTKLPLAGGNLTGELKFDTGTTQSATKGIKWTAINNNTPYIGYATDQVDGTFVLGSLKGTGYQTGLAIGGGSGNLLWKGVRVATVNDIPAYTDTNTSHNHSAGVGLTTSGSAGTGGGTYIYSANLRSTTALSVSSAAATTTSGRVYPVAVDKDGYLAVNVPWTEGTTTGPSVSSVSISTGSSNGTIKYSINGETATSVSVKGLNTAAYQPSTAFAPAYEYSTTDLTAGTSSLTTGKLYFVYE